jgi:hypothetical protein
MVEDDNVNLCNIVFAELPEYVGKAPGSNDIIKDDAKEKYQDDIDEKDLLGIGC